jgi:hypothetical protein
MSTAFSPAQLRASLWARQGSRIHAVIDGLVIPGIAEKLKSAQLAGWDCLQRGAMSAEAAARAPIWPSSARARRSRTGYSAKRPSRIRAGACSASR